MADIEGREVYINIDPAKRDRAIGVWQETAERLGGIVPDRKVNVKLIADVDEYRAAMKRAAKRTRKLTKALRELDKVTIRIRVERSHD